MDREQRARFGRLLLATTLVSAALSGCGEEEPGLRDTSAGVASHEVEVEYDVTGTTKCADLTLTTPTGIEQAADKAVPLDFDGERRGARYTFATGEYVRVSAQSCSGRNLTITCRILVEGRVIAENTSSGPYAIASCDGTA